MTFKTIQLEFQADVAVIRLNDPATLNAVSGPMCEELLAALAQVESTARALVLTGAGRGFCSGANLAANLSGSAPSGDEPDFGWLLEAYINPIMDRLRHFPFPWISAVRGAAAGVGCSFALAADLIVAGESAYFLQAFSRVGLVPDGGSSHLLVRSIGRVRALEMMLLAERVPAAQALQWGLVNRIVADELVESTALELATRLAAGPTKTFGMVRRLAWDAVDAEWSDALQAERQMQRAAGRTQDAQEGIAAFTQKRGAKFLGR